MKHEPSRPPSYRLMRHQIVQVSERAPAFQQVRGERSAPDDDGRGAFPTIPEYLRHAYWWAYLHPFSVAVFDHNPIVTAILWGWYAPLKRIIFREIQPEQRVLQAACVYGDFSQKLAERVGVLGQLDVIDVVPVQIENCRRKLRDYPQAVVRRANATHANNETYDVVCSFFLLHELPDEEKSTAVDTLLDSVAPGGKAIFIDYHKPHKYHPLKAITHLVFRLLEPFATTLWRREIASFATTTAPFRWRKEIYFGGLYQKVVAERRGISDQGRKAA